MARMKRTPGPLDHLQDALEEGVGTFLPQAQDCGPDLNPLLRDLQYIPEAELLKELDRRRKAAAAEKERKRREAADLNLTKIDAYLEIFSEHGRTGCSDDDSYHFDGRCNRCTLLNIKRDNYWPSELTVDIMLHKED